MNKVSKKELSYQVSNIDIMNKIMYPNKTKIITYNKLAQVNDITELLPSRLCVCFILLRENESNAHWTVVARDASQIFYFDSYGVGIDGEMSNITEEERNILGENVNYLSRLLHNTDLNVSWNNIEFQKYSKGNNIVNTCGKWCTVFANCVFSGLTLTQFQDRIRTLSKQLKIPYDNLVCLVYDNEFSV